MKKCKLIKLGMLFLLPFGIILCLGYLFIDFIMGAKWKKEYQKIDLDKVDPALLKTRIL